MNPLFGMDGYKDAHPEFFHYDVTELYGNMTARSGKYSNIPNGKGTFKFGTQLFCKAELLGNWEDNFFKLPKEEAVDKYDSFVSAYKGIPANKERFEKLHDLGYLPLEIKAVPEGTFVPYGIPGHTFRSTKEGFQWVQGMFETIMSQYFWPMETSLTTSVEYLRVFKEFAKKTGLEQEVPYIQAHDFSARGMFGPQAAAMSGLAHAASGSIGSDTLQCIPYAFEYYNCTHDDIIVQGPPATEHAVTCSWIEEGEKAFWTYIMDHVVKEGLAPVVADTWDFWHTVTVILPELKDKIMARDGTVVIRPDSGDPADILCGLDFATVTNKRAARDYLMRRDLKKKAFYISGEEKYYMVSEDDVEDCWIPEHNFESLMECEVKGLIEVLWDIFGGTITDKGYKLLDSHIGAIYGDSITLERQRDILQRLEDKGFASMIVLGIGSYTFQYVTRDTHGSAIKSTSMVKSGRRVPIFKDPKGDSNKSSHKGLLYVGYDEEGNMVCEQNVTEEREKEGILETVYKDGALLKDIHLDDVRATVAKYL